MFPQFLIYTETPYSPTQSLLYSRVWMLISARVDGSSPQRVWHYKGNIVIKDTTECLFYLSYKLRKPSSSLNSQMGFMNVLKFSAACFDLLGWPLCALGYPLVPFWPYIKLMVICWLVIQQFDGSYYVYQHLVQPCLSMDPQAVMNWLFNESKKKFHSRENFLVSADRYIKENGPEALEKLLSRKLRSAKPNVEVKKIKAPAAPEKKGEQWKCEEPNVAQKEIQVVKVTEIKNGGDGAKRCEWPNAAKKEVKVTEVTHRTFGGTAQWVKRTEINLGETRSNTTCAVEIKERAAALVAAEIEACRDDRTPKIPLHEKVQKEWACAVCQVTTQSEATFNSHLQGKRHQATSEQLRAKNQATKTNCSPSASMAKKSDQSTKEEQPKCTSNNLNSKNNGISAASTVKKPDDTKDDERQKSASSNEPNQKNNKKQEVQTNEQGHQKNLKQTGDGMKELRLCCNICNVSCTSELDMASHLNGWRHFNMIKEASELWCSNCNVRCNSEAVMALSPKWEEALEAAEGTVGIIVQYL
ncbi:HVA22-like protein a [Vitis vinifera]|uniref:HVA22-like protein a n=1 Tax=Vitis vinifera TaxID=29760 RepID=A0A438DL59_VITVI|nr:HVA22-like protein a [Vitis vinifera]